MKKKAKENNHEAKRYNRKSDSGLTNFTYFGCGKQSHIKIECPNLVCKEKSQEKKNSKIGKTKRAYISWEDNDTCST